jgi:SAM-dependent methyltransferase
VTRAAQGTHVARDLDRVVVWHDVECGTYAGDIALWLRLAADNAGPVLELGCGTGRLALTLARAGHEVVGLEREPALIAELQTRARSEVLVVDAVTADAREFSLDRRFGLVLAPMQLTHLLGGAEGRRSMLRYVSDHLAPSGRAALALLAGDVVSSPASSPPLPDVLERDGWVYSSLPVEVRGVEGGLEVRRLRQAVSPHGELSEELDVTRLDVVTPDELEREAAECGLRATERRAVPPTADHVGSTVIVLEAS